MGQTLCANGAVPHSALDGECVYAHVWFTLQDNVMQTQTTGQIVVMSLLAYLLEKALFIVHHHGERLDNSHRSQVALPQGQQDGVVVQLGSRALWGRASERLNWHGRC